MQDTCRKFHQNYHRIKIITQKPRKYVRIHAGYMHENSYVFNEFELLRRSFVNMYALYALYALFALFALYALFAAFAS